jgi:hypothetical protein
MSVVAQVLAIVEGLGVALLGVLAAFSFRSPRLRGVFLIDPEDQEVVRPWAISFGFSNLCWGLGALVGVVAVNLGFAEVGRTLVVFVSIATIIRALAILFGDLRYWKLAAPMVLIPALVLVAMVV